MCAQFYASLVQTDPHFPALALVAYPIVEVLRLMIASNREEECCEGVMRRRVDYINTPLLLATFFTYVCVCARV